MADTHVQGINWQLTHELYEAEISRVNAGTSTLGVMGDPVAKQWLLRELTRMNAIAVAEAEKQS